MPIIAIDGLAASGKGTLARKLGECFDYRVMDTGLLYRFLSFLLVSEGIDSSFHLGIIQFLGTISQESFENLEAHPRYYLPEISQYASQIAVMPEVRTFLLDLQRTFAASTPRGAILDGRDIGTVICPHAEVKIFVSASLEQRAMRRYRQYQEQVIVDVHKSFLKSSPTYEDVLAELHNRDSRDSLREICPMRIATGALVIDTTSLTAEDTFAIAEDFVHQVLKI